MVITDYIVILLYIIGIVATGMVFSNKLKNTKDMFAAGGQSPWWVSGLSGFMTMFSAGTFVVWGGIAYRYGFVAVMINMCYGIAALLVGFFLAGHWRKIGVNSAPEFLQMRFGGSIVQFYSWFQGTVGIFAVGGAIYALAKIVCALIPLAESHFLVDHNTGLLSVQFASIILCLMVILIAFSGGLWAVLMTDVLQFIILVISVLFVVPLILREVGGWNSFIEQAPEGFTSPVAADFTWWFLTGWIVIHFFKIGGEWSFVQRFTCVPSPKDARKAAFIFGFMYLISPLIWMLPALVYRVIDPTADFEQAYILSCKKVLPPGMMGLMLAAMISATASAATSQLNVFAGAFTTEVYQGVLNRDASQKHLVLVGRTTTVVLGGIILAGSLLIPLYGYTSFIIDLTTLLTGPLVLPTIWGLFSKKINIRSVWITTLLGFFAAAVVKFGFSDISFLNGIELFEPISHWISSYERIANLIAGIIIPLVILLVLELTSTKEQDGYRKVNISKQNYELSAVVQASILPAKMIVVALTMIGILMATLALFSRKEKLTLSLFAVLLFIISTYVYLKIRKTDKVILSESK